VTGVQTCALPILVLRDPGVYQALRRDDLEKPSPDHVDAAARRFDPYPEPASYPEVDLGHGEDELLPHPPPFLQLVRVGPGAESSLASRWEDTGDTKRVLSTLCLAYSFF